MFKRGSKGLSARERRNLGGDWYAKVKIGEGRWLRVRLCSDADVSRRWLADLKLAVVRRRNDEVPDWDRIKRDRVPGRLIEQLGIDSKIATKRRAKWDDHITDYTAKLRTKGCGQVYIDNCRRCLTILGTDCGWRRIGDADADRFQQYLDERREADTGARTLNNIRSILIGFLDWAVKLGRCDGHKIKAVDRIEESTDRRRVRRALDRDECKRLLHSTKPDRELVYRLALASGLRRRELILLEWRDVRLDDPQARGPYLQLRAEATKSKRADEVPLSDDMARRLRTARPTFTTPTMRVFKRVPMFKAWKGDLARAGIEYRSDDGRIVGFHSLRVTLGTALEQLQAPRAARHSIMRHQDPSVSYRSYVDTELIDLWGLVNRLPTYDDDAAQQLRKTGTMDAKGADQAWHQNWHQKCGGTCHSESATVAEVDSGLVSVGSTDGAETPINRGENADNSIQSKGWMTGFEPATPRITT